MDKLIELSTKKLRYTLLLVLGFLFTGVSLIFVWNRNLFLNMGIIRLVLLSLAISFVVFCPIFIIKTIQYLKMENEDSDDVDIVYDELFILLFESTAIADAIMYLAMLCKLHIPDMSIVLSIDIYILCVVVIAIRSAVSIIRNKRKKKK